ncbi:uncharacterized protein LOC142387995 isoform X3 [Odontesthes bonariensis]|uniref:uncharacterized protein LOC142387995 isoform X3 n=1 Tax=Odontesthes bonariensis TaxID=219752 RepID=UPI003F5833AE
MNPLEERLAEEVRRYEHLYNPSLAEHKGDQMSANSWTEISGNLGMPVQDCLKLWRKIRDKYVRQKKMMEGSRGGAGRQKVPAFFLKLSWLGHHIKHRQTSSSCDEQGRKRGSSSMNPLEERLAEEVRRYEHLYNPSLAEHKDDQMSANSWTEISGNLGIPVQDCLKLWRKIRDKYVRQKKMMEGSRGGAGRQKVPAFFLKLSWLGHHIKHRQTSSSCDEGRKRGSSSMNPLEERLAEEVRRYEHLYNPSLAEHKGDQMSANSWTEISGNLGIPVQDCLKLWRKIRDKYVRQKKMMEGSSGDAGRQKVPAFFLKLSWLGHHIKHRQTSSSCDEKSSPSKLKRDRPDFTVDEDREETKPEVKVEEESVENRQAEDCGDDDEDDDDGSEDDPPQEEDEGRDSGGYYEEEETEVDPFEAEETSDTSRDMSDFTADEDREETKPEVKVEEESVEYRQEIEVEVKMEEDDFPAGEGEQHSQETEQQPEQDAADQAEQVKAEGDKGGNQSRKRPYEESRGYSYEHREEKRSRTPQPPAEDEEENIDDASDICKTKWKGLRDTFVRTQKKPLPSRSAGGTHKQWKYYEKLSFLLPHIQPRSSKGNLSLIHQEEEERSPTPQSLSGSEDSSSTPGISLPPAATSALTTFRSRSPRECEQVEPFEAEETSDTSRDMSDFTADEDREETKPEVKVEEESVENIQVEVKMEEDDFPAGEGEQHSQETVEGDRGGSYSSQSVKGSHRFTYNEGLIAEVEQHTILYDTTHPFYKDNARKERTWHLIAGVVGVDADICKTKWKGLRDTFVRTQKKPLPSRSAGGTHKQWKYYEKLSFLLPHIQPRSSKGNLSLIHQEEEERSPTPQSLSGSEDSSSTPGISLPPAATSALTTFRSRSPRECEQVEPFEAEETSDTSRDMSDFTADEDREETKPEVKVEEESVENIQVEVKMEEDDFPAGEGEQHSQETVEGDRGGSYSSQSVKGSHRFTYNEGLIAEVEQHTILYDTTHPFYKDNARKERTWHLIAGVVGVDADTCKTKWKGLRDTFVRTQKKPLPSRSAGGTQKQWKYYEKLSFLLPHIQPRSSKGNLSLIHQEEEERSPTPQSLSGSEDSSSTPGISLPPAATSALTMFRSRSPRECEQVEPFEAEETSDTSRDMSDFTADEDREETKPEVKVEEESVENIQVEVKMEEDDFPAGEGEQHSQETVEGDRGGSYSSQSVKGSHRLTYNEGLIAEVEQHTILYDTTHPFYKDNARKERTWHLIAGVVGVDADTCKTKWKGLRDTFVRTQKKPLPSGSAGGTHKQWQYYEKLSFLLPHIQPRSSKGNLSLIHQEEEERSPTPQSLSGSEDSSSTPGISLPPAATSALTTFRSRSPRDRASRPAAAAPAPRQTRRVQREDTDLGERLMSLLGQPVPKPHVPDGELDEAYHFALSLVPMLHRLNADQRQRAKIEILTVLHNLERGQAQQQPPPAPGPSPHHQADSPPTTNGVVDTNAHEYFEDRTYTEQFYTM